MNYFEVKDRLENLVRFRSLYVEYIGFTNREENPAAQILREKMQPLVPITVDSIRQVGLGGLVTRDAPVRGGRKVRVNLIKAIFRDAVIRRFSLTDREPLELLDKGILAYQKQLWVQKLQLFNPLFWVYQIVLWLARLPLTICRASGFDTSKAEQAAFVKLYLFLFQVGFYVWVAKAVGLFSWLRADIIAL
jgi:hypothetical protein